MPTDTIARTQLCAICQEFDVRALLLAAEQEAASQDETTWNRLNYQSVRFGLLRYFKHQPNLLALRDSAHDCDLCNAIWRFYSSTAQAQELTDEALSSGTGQQQVWLSTTAWDATLYGMPYLAAYQHGEHSATRTLAWFGVCAERGHVPSDDSRLLARSIFRHSNQDDCLSLAHSWLQNCLLNHKKCTWRGQEDLRFPTRVLDVGNAISDKVRLVHGDGRQGHFAALSYCWGGDGVLTLTQRIPDMLRAGVDLERFPATLRDAIIITRKLEIRFLWVDALCIMQDSAEDWAAEAGRMRTVYRGAIVTIAAASATSTGEGIFRERSPRAPYCKLEWRSTEGQPTSVSLRPGSELSDSTLRNAKISTRGWTLQESLLAPRTLWFGMQQIAFECAENLVDEGGRTTKATEDYRNKAAMAEMISDTRHMLLTKAFRATGIPPIVSIPWLSYRSRGEWKEERNPGVYSFLKSRIRKTDFAFQGLLTTPGGKPYTYYDQWREIVQRYTSRHLTHQSDVLPALSGLADNFQQVTGDQYLAGLWKGDLLRGLGWQRSPERKWLEDGTVAEVVPLQEYLAPSWSWASVYGKSATFPSSLPHQSDNEVFQMAKIVDVSVEPATSDPYGRLKHGHLTLRAPYLTIDDPIVPSTSKHWMSTLHRVIHTVLHSKMTAQCHEFVQQHAPHESQQFALLHLFTWKQAGRVNPHGELCLLLLESTKDGNYKRLANFGERHLGALDPQDKQIRDELKAAPFVKKVVTIV